jgi:hypothetical protein
MAPVAVNVPCAGVGDGEAVGRNDRLGVGLGRVAVGASVGLGARVGVTPQAARVENTTTTASERATETRL